MDAFDQIHQAGVEHDEFVEGDILVDERGRVSVIDFEEAFEMKCKRRRPIPGLGDLCPDEARFGCRELWTLGSMMGMWKPRT